MMIQTLILNEINHFLKSRLLRCLSGSSFAIVLVLHTQIFVSINNKSSPVNDVPCIAEQNVAVATNNSSFATHHYHSLCTKSVQSQYLCKLAEQSYFLKYVMLVGTPLDQQ